MGVRRVVTGVNDRGRSCVVADGATPAHASNVRADFDEMWILDALPPDPGDPRDPVADLGAVRLKPPAGGITWRVVTYPPGMGDPDRPPPALTNIEGGGAYEHGDPRWHTTHSVDFAVVISGELVLGLDEEEVQLRAGDCVVQRGTRHAWFNRGSEPCVVSFVLISADPSDGS
jgi:mannose-6-phosphate isomerase-like protein (cupin superfamily)